MSSANHSHSSLGGILCVFGGLVGLAADDVRTAVLYAEADFRAEAPDTTGRPPALREVKGAVPQVAEVRDHLGDLLMICRLILNAFALEASTAALGR